GPFDNIVWDAAIEHFTEKEIDTIMGTIVQRLGADGILSGYTLTEDKTGKKSNALHEYEFKDKEDLRRFFTPHFKHVKVWETIYPTRHNLYFAASQSPIDVMWASRKWTAPGSRLHRRFRARIRQQRGRV